MISVPLKATPANRYKPKPVNYAHFPTFESITSTIFLVVFAVDHSGTTESREHLA